MTKSQLKRLGRETPVLGKTGLIVTKSLVCTNAPVQRARLKVSREIAYTPIKKINPEHQSRMIAEEREAKIKG